MAHQKKPVVFFAYSGGPALLAESMRAASSGLTSRSVRSQTWQDLKIQGRLMIDRVLEAIDESRVVLAEVGNLNSNVLFEAGYALAKDKNLWLLIDESDQEATRNWRDIGLFSNIGRVGYGGSSNDLVHRFMQARPDISTAETLWSDLFAKIRSPRQARSLFYLPAPLNDDPARAVSQTMARRRELKIVQADDDERGMAPLDWYVNQIYSCSATVVHLMSESRARAKIHNARASFLAGLAHGLDRPLLLLAPSSLPVPLDYRDLLTQYDTARGLSESLHAWLGNLPIKPGSRAQPGRLKLSVELPVSFGEYVAEDERDHLPEYFLETAEYQAVLRGGTSVFVGRKGTGKSATMLRASDELAVDKRNLVVAIKPSGYELESLIGVISALPDKASADYFLEGLWKYLLYCEIAVAGVQEAEDRPAGIASGSAMERLRDLLMRQHVDLGEGLAVRLERVVEVILTDLPDSPLSVKEMRGWLNSRLYTALLSELRRAIGEALADRLRVALLIDNLDKAWERGADYRRLARMIFGLLTAVGKVSAEFSRDANSRQKLDVSLAVFLRADIFDVVRRFAREPDKISTLQIKWDDSALLARVLEDRYVASKGVDTELDSLWSDFFCPSVGGVDTRAYMLWRCLSRPRDLVYLCNAAVMSATNARRSVIEAVDIQNAEREYSQFAFEALLVETDPTAGLNDLLFEFAGSTATMTYGEFSAVLSSAADHNEDVAVSDVISILLRASFIGLEISDGNFEAPPDETAEKKTRALAKRLADGQIENARVRIHPAYRPYLEISDDEASTLR